MITVDGKVPPDASWYHVGLMTQEEVLLALTGPPETRRVPYIPDDPRSIDQKPYIEFVSRDRTPQYQKEHAER